MASPGALEQRLAAEAWGALGGAPEELSGLHLEGSAPPLGSVLPVAELVTAGVGVGALAAARLLGGRRGEPAAAVRLDRQHAVAACASEALLRVDGEPGAAGWAPLSRFFEAADGFVRLHGNYPHHRDALLSVLGTDEAGAPDAIRAWPARELEAALVPAGGAGVAVRTEATWRTGEQDAAVRRMGLVELERIGDGPAGPPDPAPAGRPAEGMRVLDLTRVIAGPVCSRMLAAHGAEVLRLDPPQRPELRLHHLDGDWGKRTALVDIATPAGRETVEELLTRADVVVCGYRPGALDRHGLGADALAERHPGTVIVALSAWGEDGPWAGRRGFDSLVQAASGIARVESPDRDPGALPLQALDHVTGHLLAAGALLALDARRRKGGTWRVRASLARTAAWLLDQPRNPRTERAIGDLDRHLLTVPSVHGTLRAVRPPGVIDGFPAPAWPAPPGVYGADAPQWRPG